MKALETTPGPLPSRWRYRVCGGVNFCVYSKHATAVELLFFDGPDAPQAAETIRLPAWPVAGSVWAVDFTGPRPMIESRYPYLLAVRDLTTGYQSLWRPVTAATGEVARDALAALFAEHGAPLVLKSDNGSPFTSAVVEGLLAGQGVAALFSPPHWPRYNGAVEAGIGSLKDRTDAWAAIRARGRVELGRRGRRVRRARVASTEPADTPVYTALRETPSRGVAFPPKFFQGDRNTPHGRQSLCSSRDHSGSEHNPVGSGWTPEISTEQSRRLGQRLPRGLTQASARSLSATLRTRSVSLTG